MSEPLCRADEIAEGEARGFTFGSGLARTDVIVLRRDGVLHAYINACPHIGTPLDMMPDDFLSEDGDWLVCATHGALFRPQDGHCVEGPCEGDRLEKLDVEIDPNGCVIVKHKSNTPVVSDT